MTDTRRILLVLTSHATKGTTGKPTGVWLEELAAPYYIFLAEGFEVDIASIAGGKVPLDPASVDGEHPPCVARFLADTQAMQVVNASRPLAGLSAVGYDAVFLPGGHGTMWDLPESQALASLLGEAWADGKVVAAVCHGPSGLLSAKDAEGQPLVAGRNVTGFSNAEEEAAGLTDVVPFLLENRLTSLGGLYKSGPDFQPFALRDGKLVTGQNPASSEQAARLTIEAIRVER
ncbi:type 1 glutamine amidotransferase domain-containing protein [Rhizobium sp. 18065]|uniref:type 1 glutamine amidotransferase domain-containing protein n=1 Tax=Rhizobium sp. 18065 TaxID=2681411 RepID=UPI00135889C0|nr:type 1 glutamine amidotransferase domain-containing protein [Rhizobium sp. 18065]